jgi:hypothetical protein
MSVSWFFLYLLFFTRETVAATPWSPVPPEQTAVLKELFESTNGPDWTDNSGWLVADSPCDWYGVVCSQDYADGKSSSNIRLLSLTNNNLSGTLPSSLAQLPALQGLYIEQNKLHGDVPPELLARWDDHEFEFRGSQNSFSNMVKKIRLLYSSSGVLCSLDDDVRYVLEVQEYGSSRLESIRCVEGTERETHCLVMEGNGPYLERLSRGLELLHFRDLESEYWHPFTGATHQEFITTTVWWGDGTEKSVMTYGRQGPIEVWMAQQLFFGLREDVFWETKRFEAVCPSMKKD